MNLYEYIINSPNGENTVFDKDYDIEVYFYKEENSKDPWDKAMMDFAKLLTVVRSNENSVTVNMAELIESKLEKLDKLFKINEIDEIMFDIENILSGNVSENWLIKFVEELS